MIKTSYFLLNLPTAISLIFLFFNACREKDDPIQLPSVSTLSVTQITSSTALSGGSITNDGGSPIIARGVVWALATNPSLEQHNGITSDGAGEGLYTSNLSGLDPESDYFVRAYATNSVGTAYGVELNFTTEPFVCGTSTIIDTDGNVYNTVLINTQCWMKENLKTTKYRNGTPIIYPGTDNSAWNNNNTGAYSWYDNDINWKDSYGALYNWHAVNNTNDLCPTGWHVPSGTEWTQLRDYVVAQGFPNSSNETNGAGNALKSCRQINSPLGGDCSTALNPRWDSHNIFHGFDEFGFSVLPGGYRTSGGTFNNIGGRGYWWSSTEYSINSAWYRFLNYSGGNVFSYYSFKTNGFSVRCLRD